MPEVGTGGVRIHFDRDGDGDPVLLLHGALASGECWRRAGYLDALAADHEVLTVDFRGHARSSRPHDEAMYGLHHDVADALAVIDAAGLASVTVCGWSWGGTTGLALAALHPERVRAVVAVGASGRHGGFSDVPSDFTPFPEQGARLEKEGMGWVADEIDRLGGQPWLGDVIRENDHLAMAAWYRAQPHAIPTGRALAEVRQPVFFVVGEDELSLLDFPRPILPAHAGLHVIPGANHVSAFLTPDVVVPALKALNAAARTG
jgi:pimeloyl-ACP methyl ester carboxylesterase